MTVVVWIDWGPTLEIILFVMALIFITVWVVLRLLHVIALVYG